MKSPDVQVGKQLFVGIGVPEPLKVGEDEIRGSCYMEGPLIVGDCPAWNTGTTYQGHPNPCATIMIGPLVNKDIQSLPNVTAWVQGPSGAPGIMGDNAVVIEGDLYVSGMVDCGNKGRLARRFGVADLLGKIFDMQHPTLGKGYRLAHACIEGAEVAIYHRGRVKNSNEIKLPYYWKDLVHENSISVQLQPIGSHQDVIVKKWDDEKIYLQSNGGMPIDCFYHVYAERKDINPLHVEYKGDTHEEYPDPNHRNFDPSDETRNLLDERYRGPRNTITKNKNPGEVARNHLTTDIADVEPVPVDETD